MDPKILELIVAGLAGIPLAGLTEIFKLFLIRMGVDAAWKFLGYVASAVTCLAVSAITLLGLHLFVLGPWLLYALVSFAVANGLYKMTAKKTATIINAAIDGLTKDVVMAVRSGLRSEMGMDKAKSFRPPADQFTNRKTGPPPAAPDEDTKSFKPPSEF